MKARILVALPLLLAAGFTAAQDAPSFLIDAGPCLGFSTAVERLVCFEEQVKQAEALETAGAGVRARAAQPALSIRPVAPAPGGPTTTVSRPQATAPAPTAGNELDNFGLEQGTRVSKDKKGREELISTIAELREFIPNQYLITLANGQVWRQVRPERYRLDIEQEVRIYPTRWGSSFRLSVEKLGGFIQVERVK